MSLNPYVEEESVLRKDWIKSASKGFDASKEDRIEPESIFTSTIRD